MSAFKDAVSNDVMNVFINVDEFADRHFLNDREVLCIVDKDLTSGSSTARIGNQLEGVFMNAVTIYVRESDMVHRPVEGELLYLDEKMFIVRSVSSEMGILVILAEVNDQ